MPSFLHFHLVRFSNSEHDQYSLLWFTLLAHTFDFAKSFPPHFLIHSPLGNVRGLCSGTCLDVAIQTLPHNPRWTGRLVGRWWGDAAAAQIFPGCTYIHDTLLPTGIDIQWTTGLEVLVSLSALRTHTITSMPGFVPFFFFFFCFVLSPKGREVLGLWRWLWQMGQQFLISPSAREETGPLEPLLLFHSIFFFISVAHSTWKSPPFFFSLLLLYPVYRNCFLFIIFFVSRSWQQAPQDGKG